MKTIVKWLIEQVPELRQALEDLGWTPPQAADPRGGGGAGPVKPK